MPTVRANGIRLNYEQVGSGPNVVMVHGLAANLAFWYLKSVPFLRHDFRITVYDLRGHGRSEMPPRGYAPSVMADDLEALLDALTIERVHLVGHSFGGIIALEFALRAPRRLASLTIADTRLDAFQPTLRLKDWPHFDIWKKRLRQIGLPEPDPEEEADYLLLMHERHAAQPALPLVQTGAQPPLRVRGERRAVQRWLRLLESTTARVDFRSPGPSRERLRQLAPPVLAMFGGLSHCLPTCDGLRALIDCRVVVIPGVGHFFPLSRPRLFALALRTFLLHVERQGTLRTLKVQDEATRTTP
jgi:pimeloyl-ACP methyl ester carboxylesterase